MRMHVRIEQIMRICILGMAHRCVSRGLAGIISLGTGSTDGKAAGHTHIARSHKYTCLRARKRGCDNHACLACIKHAWLHSAMWNANACQGKHGMEPQSILLFVCSCVKKMRLEFVNLPCSFCNKKTTCCVPKRCY
jgi:hypothetical protein